MKTLKVGHLDKLVFALLISVGHGTWAAGNIETVTGEASITNRDGQPRTAVKGDRVVEGDTLATGAAAELILVTDDSGVLAIRPMSRLIIEKYEITGTDKDTVALKLLRGALRSITGWISKTAPRNYRVTTATATIGIRGTDHETVVVEGGSGAATDSGTFDRVYSGETALETEQGSLFLKSGQTGQATDSGRLPQLLPQAPVALYPARPSDSAIELLKQDAQGNQTLRLQTRQDLNRRSGGTSPQGNPVISSQCTPDAPAQRALDEFLRAYEQGNIGFIQRRLDPSLIGYSAILNDIMRDANVQKQSQVRILERQMQCGPDVSVIDFTWEKRFIDVASFAPQLERGRASVLLSGLGSGLTGQWRISGFTGDNPFRTSNSSASFQASPSSASYAGIPGVCTVSGSATVAANKPYTVNTGPVCIPAGNGSCTYTNAAFPTATTLSPPAAVNSCVSSGFLTAVTVTGTGAASFSGTPGSTVALTSIVTATGSNGASSMNVTLTCNTSVTISPSAPCTSSPSQIAVNFTVTDSARAGQPFAQVQVVGSNGDRETLQLNATSPGKFTLLTLPIQKSATVLPGSGRLEFAGPTSFTLAYRAASGVQTVRTFNITP